MDISKAYLRRYPLKCFFMHDIRRPIRLQYQVLVVHEPLWWSTGKTSSLLRLSMEIGTILDLLHAAISCVCHQFNTFLTALQHLASYMYCVGILGPEDHSWQECSTSSDVMHSKEAEARFERSFNVRRGAEDLFLQCTQESPKICRQWRHIPHVPCKHKTCWVWPDPYLHDCTKAVTWRVGAG